MSCKPRGTDWILKTVVGCAIFGLGFNIFLIPNGLNAGGLSGLAMVLVYLLRFGTVGLITAIVNLPLFMVAGVRIGKRFVLRSLVGMMLCSTSIDVFSGMPAPTIEPLLGALYGGAVCGFGIGIVLSSGGSTGGSDILVRLVKRRWPDIPFGIISTAFDLSVAALTGWVFGNMEMALYSGIAIFIGGRVLDAVVYRFDYSRVALIISAKHELVAKRITQELTRGVTFLNGEGYYSGCSYKVILTAVKRQQLTELKQLVVNADPDAFVIVQQAHQVLGDGFSRYSHDSV